MLAWLACLGVQAHENLPASLLIEQVDEQVFDVRWRIPTTQGPAPDVSPRLPAECSTLAGRSEQSATTARITQWRVRCPSGLRAGAQIAFDGLATSLIDVLVRVGWQDGSSLSSIARASSSVVTLSPAQAPGMQVSGYLRLGVEHILGGTDHLLFVLCLTLLVRGRVALLKTITAFTLAHSVTLGLSALGVVRVPQAPLEATIALSILFLARELASARAQDGTAARRPWAAAFAFGLLHGFGFAGALAEVGLPSTDVPSALLLFNIGIETGQLLFVAAVLTLLALGRRSRWSSQPGRAPRMRTAVVYVVGAVSSFWCLERMTAVVGA